MNDDQIRMMIRNGMYFGAHGNKHCWMNILEDKEKELEITHSIDYLSSVGASIKDWVMCYPYGGYDDSLLGILKRKECLVGLTTNVAIADLSKCDPLLLPRLDTNDLPKDSSAPVCKWTEDVSISRN